MSHKQANSPGLFDALNIFRRRFRYVISATLLGTVVAGAYFWTLKPVYESVTAFMVDLPENLPNRSGEPTSEGTNLDPESLADHVIILESHDVIAAALQKAGTTVVDSLADCLEEDQTEIEYIVENLRVTRGGEGQRRNARVITVRLRHDDPEECEVILNAIIASYQDWCNKRSGVAGDQSIATIEEKLVAAKQDLDEANENYDKFRDATPQLIGHEVDRINPYQEEVSKCIASRAEIRARKIETGCRIETVRRLLKDKVGEEFGLERIELLRSIAGKSVGPETVEAEKAEVNELWQMIRDEKVLLEQYGPGHPLVRRTRAGINGMRDLLSEKRRQREKAIALSLVSDLRELNQREIQETKRLKEALASARKLDVDSREDEKLRAQVEHKTRIYDMWSNRFDEATIGKDHGAVITSTLTPVQVGEPINTSPAMILAIGLMVGLFMGLGLAVVVDNLDAGAIREADIKVTRQPRVMHDSQLHHVRPNVGAAV